MNFKPTLLKTIVSVVVGIILLLLVFTQVIPQSPAPTAYSINWFEGIASIIIIYVVWSLIQKK